MELWYLYQSGFALEIDRHFIIFDYWRDTPPGGALADGVIAPGDLRGRDVTVFVSHAHSDHYNPVIFEWSKAPARRIRHILSSDIGRRPEALTIGPNETLNLGDMTIRTLRSNDEGVAFLIKAEDKTIYHAGDLNWWHWAGEPDDYNADMEARYKSQIELLRGETIDLAMVPVDPRLGDQYAWGIDWFMRTVGAAYVAPMHFADDVGVIGRLLRDPVSEPYRDRILPIAGRGDHRILE